MPQKTPQSLTNKIDQDFFEYVVAYNALTDETYLSAIIDHLRPTFFKNPDIKTIVSLVAEFYQKRSTVPTITELKTYLVTDTLKTSFKNVVANFKYIDAKFNKQELYENTEKFFREKAVYEAILKTVNDYSDNKVNTSDTLTVFEKACSISLVDDLGHNYFKEIDKHCKDLQTTYTYISSGWKWLDSKIEGGFLASGRALYVFSGFTNSGKSIFLGNLAVNFLKQNKKVLIISLEMSESIYSKRISTQISKIPVGKLSSTTEQLKDNIIDYKKQYPGADLLVKEFPPKSITCNHIKAYIKKLIAKGFKPDVILVDYINLINPTIITPSSYENVKSVAEQLRALTYVFEVPIISATQINRSGAGVANPGLELVSESIGLTFTVDVQFAIWSDEGDKELGVIHLGLQKNRFGPAVGSTTLRIDYDTLSLSEMENEFFTNTAVKDTLTGLDKILS